MDPMLILGLLGVLGGAFVSAIANVQTAQSQAKADQTKADQLTELSKPGGYYDQIDQALKSDLADISADREAAGKLLGIETVQAASQIVQAKEQGAQAQRQVTQAQEQVTHQELADMRQGAQAVGNVAATAGAGNLAQTGSVAVQKESIQMQTKQTIGYGEQQKAYGEQQKTYIQGSVQRSIEEIGRNVQKAQLDYENTLRGLDTQKAKDLADQTLNTFKQTTGITEAANLNTEADWLNTWGVGLGIASGVFQGLAGMASFSGSLKQASTNAGVPQSPYDYSTGGNLQTGGNEGF